jgi:hypothetical protein
VAAIILVQPEFMYLPAEKMDPSIRVLDGSQLGGMLIEAAGGLAWGPDHGATTKTSAGGFITVLTSEPIKWRRLS